VKQAQIINEATVPVVIGAALVATIAVVISEQGNVANCGNDNYQHEHKPIGHTDLGLGPVYKVSQKAEETFVQRRYSGRHPDRVQPRLHQSRPIGDRILRMP